MSPVLVEANVDKETQMNDDAQAPAGQEQVKATPAPKPAKAKAKVKPKAKPAVKAKAKKGITKGLKGPGVLRVYAPQYHKDKEKKTAGGHVSVDSNDTLAQKLRGKTLDEVFAQAAKVLRDEDDKPIAEATLRKQYKHLNVGMQRMNLGNRIRGVLNAK